MKAFKRIIAVSLLIATLSVNMCSLAFADISSDRGSTTDWWTAQLHRLAGRSDGYTILDVPLGAWMAEVAADLCGAVCELSDDHWHHADEHDYIRTYELSDGNYIEAKCKYCHKQFVGGPVTPDSLSDAYSDYVSTLPAGGYDSAGTLLWQPSFKDATKLKVYTGYGSTRDLVAYPPKYSPTDLYNITLQGGALIYDFIRQTYNRYDVGIYECSVPFPITGLYVGTNNTMVSLALYDSDLETLKRTEFMWGKIQQNGTAGAALTFKTSSFSANNSGGRAVFYAPILKVYPADTSLVTNNYLINTRVNNFNGDYYDSVTNNNYSNTTIINETTNNYYDMTTNNNYTMSNWSYDYASRTYFITLEDGTTVTVQFGDDCMTITKNDVTNSYQYVIKNNSTPDTPTTCKHDWQETIDTAPTCLEGGHASYTCSKCGETYEQILAAKGHDWKVIEHVNMVYNSDGTVATQGHTLYQCSVCGEQWYTDTGAPPPDVSGSSSILAWLQAFQTWLDEKLDLTPVLERLDAILAELQSTSGSTTCEHTYEQHMEQDADCTLPGLQVSTCSQCGDSYSEIIDPLGHDWVISSHVDAVTDPDTGEETASAYDIYTCSRCGKTYEDHTGDGAPDEDYSSSSISQLVVKVFSKLGTFAGKLIGFIVRLFDKAISSVDEVISKFNEYTEQISGFGGDYPAWLTGFWTVLPSELQVALTFAVVCMVLGIVGKKLFFS